MSLSWKHYLPLLKKKRRHEAGKCIIEGVRLCREALVSQWGIEIAFVTQAFADSEHWTAFEDTFRHHGIDWRVLGDQQFKRLSDTETPQGILLVMQIPRDRYRRPSLRRASFVLLLDGIRDPGNLGTLIRTADWYGVNAIILSQDSVDPYNPKVLRSSMGAIFHVPVYFSENLAEDAVALKEHRYWIVAAAVNGKKVLQTTHFKKPVALVLGSEARGISASLQNRADLTVRIWKYGQAESLNVAVAGGVVMHHVAAQIFDTR